MSPQRAIEYTDLMKKMKIKKETLKRAGIIAGGAAVAAAIVLLLLFGTKRCSHPTERGLLSEEEEMSAPNLMYGIEYENYDVITEKVGSGQTLSHILDGLGVGPATVDRIDRESRSVFDMRGMRRDSPTRPSWNTIRSDGAAPLRLREKSHGLHRGIARR